jgi:hypothetical protein
MKTQQVGPVAFQRADNSVDESVSEDPPTGTVYIAQGDGIWNAYWDALPDDKPRMIERGPGWTELQDALRWAATRAPRVWVRVGGQEHPLWSGLGPPIEGRRTLKEWLLENPEGPPST